MKHIFLLLTCITVLLSGCGSRDAAAQKWDCSVTNAATSSEKNYVITYSPEEVVSEAGTLTLQNRSDFPLTIHLLTEGEEERIAEIPVGGVSVQHEITPGQVYTIGIHAVAEVNAELPLMVYDGEWSEPFE